MIVGETPSGYHGIYGTRSWYSSCAKEKQEYNTKKTENQYCCFDLKSQYFGKMQDLTGLIVFSIPLVSLACVAGDLKDVESVPVIVV
jgi:uncharacterized protein (DUF2252 family)